MLEPEVDVTFKVATPASLAAVSNVPQSPETAGSVGDQVSEMPAYGKPCRPQPKGAFGSSRVSVECGSVCSVCSLGILGFAVSLRRLKRHLSQIRER